jgi:hypothetical protein
MAETTYRDLLWDVTVQPAKGDGTVGLLAVASEQELFAGKAAAAEGERLAVQPQWFGDPTRQTAAKSRSSEIPAAPALRDVGRQLWEAISLAAKQPLLEATSEQPCRLKISCDWPALDDLPWEWLNDGADPPFALRPGVRIARSMPIRQPIPPLSVEAPIRVLLVLASLTDERLQLGQRELDAIQPRLNSPPYALEILQRPTLEELTKALHDERHIVHFIAHGGLSHGEGNIILQHSQDIASWVSGAELARMLPLTVRLVCLSTCFTAANNQILGLPRLAHSATQAPLPTLVTNRYPVSENAVRAFWASFYDALAEQRGNANEAVHRAHRDAMGDDPDASDWGSFSLVIRDQTAEVLRLAADRPVSAERYAEEIRAHLQTSLANDLAGQISSYGGGAPESVVEQYEKDAAMASDLSEGLARLD